MRKIKKHPGDARVMYSCVILVSVAALPLLALFVKLFPGLVTVWDGLMIMGALIAVAALKQFLSIRIDRSEPKDEMRPWRLH